VIGANMRPARLALVTIVALTIQYSWMSDLRLFGVTGDLLLLLTIAGGMVGGPERGAILGFIVGMAFDALLYTPFGLSALVYLLVGFATGSVHDGVIRSAWWIAPAVTLATSALGTILYVIIGQLLGQSFRTPDLFRIVVVTALLNAALSHVALRVLRWVEAGDQSFRRVRL
jgi:rod shape-determining protein MreD